MDVILRGGRVIDGSGASRRRMDVGIDAGTIAAMGDLASIDAPSLDCSGQIVCPGFIDIHSHGDITPLVDPRCISAVAQGVTTVVVGNCGHGVAPGCDPELAPLAIIGHRHSWHLGLEWSSYAAYRESLGAHPLGVNLATLVPHGAVRLAVMGLSEAPADGRALSAMRAIVAEAMSADALGLSSGLEYVPGRWADQAELIGLAEVIGSDGVYASHIRNRADRFAEAVSEALTIGSRSGCPVILSHLAARPYAPSRASELVAERLTRARSEGMRVVVDTFPDPLGPSPLASVLPPWMVSGRPRDVTARLRTPAAVKQAIASFDSAENFLVRAEGAENFLVTSSVSNAGACGRTIGELAALCGRHPAEVVCRLLAEEGDDFYSVIIQHRYANQRELDQLYLDPWCAFESDGVLTSPNGRSADVVMNRSTFGYTARVLGELVRKRRMLSLEEAVRRMTSLPAEAVGLRNRGRIAIGRPADLVVFDPATVADRSSDRRPACSPGGISLVFVNGVLAHAADGAGHSVPGSAASAGGKVLGPSD